MSAKRNKPAPAQAQTAPAAKAPPAPGLLARAGSSPVYGAILLFLLSFLLYSNTLNHDFVWDDHDLIVDNTRIQTLDGPALKSIFLDNFFKGKARVGGYYRPLVSLSYHLDYQLYGLSPSGFHFTNILINALTCSLLFWLLWSLFGSGGLAWIGSLLFAALPLHTENVAWVAGRTDLLAAFWMLFSLLFYVRWKQKQNPLYLSLCLFGFIFALLSKELAAVLPFLIVLIEYGPFPFGSASGKPGPASPPAGRFPLPVVLCFVILLLYFFLRREILGGGGSEFEPYADGFLKTITLALNIFAGYCFKLLVPFRLSAEYDAPVPDSIWHLQAAAGLILAGAIVYSAWRFRRRGEVLLAAGIFLLGLAPVMNLLPLGEISAERFLYFPSIGFTMILGVLGARIFSGRGFFHRHKTVGVTVLVLLMAGYSAKTVARNGDWKNEEVLFTKTVQASPHSARAHLNLANVHRQRGRIRQAISELDRALELRPDYVDALSNLAGIYMEQGNIQQTVPLIQKAVQFAPDNADLQNNLAIIYIQQGRLIEAESSLEAALKANPDHIRARFNLALVKFEKKDYAEAYPLFENTRDSGPEFIRSYFYLGALDINSGNFKRARRSLETFLSRSPAGDPLRDRAKSLLRETQPGGQ